ncbi:MAG: M23 family metallopeptidase, partial [Fidelibacterota bacterium]
YLKLDDGNIAVYAHLGLFTSGLSDIVKIEQERHNSYTIDKYFSPEEFRVEKGDVLGFSGESGAAFGPHLHFELRDSSNHPLNPLTHGFSLRDTRRPVPGRLAIVPLSTDAVINGSPLPQIFPLDRKKSGEYQFSDTIHVFGTVGLEVSAVDKITGLSNEFNVQGISLSVDGTDQYKIRFDRFAFQQSHLIELERDNSFRRLNDGEFHRLFATDHSHELDFISPNAEGRLTLAPGYHRVAIRMFDSMKNVVRIHGILYSAPPTKIKAAVLTASPDVLRVSLTPDGSPFPIKNFVCYSFNEKGFVEEKIEALSSRSEGGGLIVDLPRSPTRSRILQFMGINKFGAVSVPFHLPREVREADTMTMGMELSVAHLDRSVVLQVEYGGFVSRFPEVFLRGPGKDDAVEMIQIRPTTFLSVPLKPEVLEGAREVNVSIRGSQVREMRFSFKPKLATPGGSSAAISADGDCSLQVLSSTFYDTTVFWIEDVKKPVPGKGGAFMSRIYQLQPFDRPLQDTARVAIALPKSINAVSGLGIFYYDQTEGWTYLPSRFSPKKWMFFTSMYSLEAVAIVQDVVEPVIADVFPGDGARYDYQDVSILSATVKDGLAGIRNERSIRMSLDGKNLIFEYQPIMKTITYWLDEPLESGEHLLTITATDQVGNSASKEIRFGVN